MVFLVTSPPLLHNITIYFIKDAMNYQITSHRSRNPVVIWIGNTYGGRVKGEGDLQILRNTEKGIGHLYFNVLMVIIKS